MLWLDVIGIRMRDLEERSTQIKMMVNIYESAPETIVCLTEAGDCHHAMDLLGDDDIQRSLDPSAVGISSVGTPVEALTGFFDQPNWSRSWSIQEIVVSKKLIVKWETTEIPWSSIIDFTKLRNYLEGLLFPPPPPKIRFAESPEDVFSSGWDAIAAIRYLRRKRNARNEISLTELLFVSRYHKARLPQGRIYSIMGLATGNQQGDPLLREDYSLTFAEIYVNVVRYLLLRYRNLNPLSFASSYRLTDIPEIPSWVPTWRSNIIEPLSAAVALSGQPPLYSAGIKSLSPKDSQIEFSSNSADLKISGFLIRRIEQQYTQYDISTREYNWQEIVPELFPDSSSNTPDAQNSSDVVEAKCFRAHCADQVVGPDGQVYRLGAFEPSYELLKQSRWLREDRGSRVPVRAMFLSEGGYIGLGPAAAHLGDVIAVLLGASVPFILRPTEEDSEYTLIGEA
ncbi:uncharacterized protein BDZ99DRAFT_574032 [Mytilinidion resinicola]|uniref:Heterokaryon incompatibility domain-containing protein n=1 Tax=Mytilinidion resinicola TaxID=574789 RepID=A0A6A6YEU9_9PEZI|nr:uncharacterized protein BDZ99DRAFT_574032 [Mytilinidion resinicola]KAF2806534.1 hypothetical protein BDZ99DRAFT_574032 [Mytilinidion resinicola]